MGIALADFNGDGKPDIATTVGFENRIAVFLNAGDGTFAAAVSYAVGANPYSLAAGDLNGDGKLDLVTGNNGDATVGLLLNTGNGVFGTAAACPASGGAPAAITLGDLNGDGKLDVITAKTSTKGGLTVLLNRAP